MKRKLLAMIIAMMMIFCTATAEVDGKGSNAVENTANEVGTIDTEKLESLKVLEDATAAPEETGRLSGIVIGIDPGHQLKGNSEQEPVAPDSKETKNKVASGTAGTVTGVPEYQVNLDVSLMLKAALEELGCTVYMTREVNDVDISNMERALMMNELNADLVLRIHCNGSSKSSANGIGLYVNETGDIAEDSLAAAECILPRMVEATGARKDGIFRRDTYTGLNWSTVPCILVEMGFMSNPAEDVKLNDPEYQALLVQGMVEGICDTFQR